jgi:predicted NAD/FAD-binding protein
MRPSRRFSHFKRKMSTLGQARWRVVEGGSRQYALALERTLRGEFRLKHSVESITRDAGGVTLAAYGRTEKFDHVILACHADQALRLLAAPTPVEREILAHFPYQESSAILHTDESVLPRARRAWAGSNCRLTAGPAERPSITYVMNILQGIQSSNPAAPNCIRYTGIKSEWVQC